MEIPKAQLRQLVEKLLSENSTWLQRRESLHEMHDLFVSLGAMDCKQAANTSKVHLQLPSGRAIAPIQAGMCLFEIQRTRLFLEGLRDAIADLLQQFPGKTIHVVDAGCGPYVLLPLLATVFYTPEQVRFTVLDIHAFNLESARTLTAQLGLTPYFSDFILTDATTWQCPANALPDIVFSETMNTGLEKEPQVAITLNLAAQMEPHSILLPESVSVTLSMHDQAARKKIKSDPSIHHIDTSSYEEELVKIIELTKQSTLEEITKDPLCQVTIPSQFNDARHRLMYMTGITVYKNYRLKESECSLTLPLQLEPIGKTTIKAGDQLAFHYELNAAPRIVFSKLK